MIDPSSNPPAHEAKSKKKLRTYKELAARYAVTIPALKEQLRAGGWLVGDEPAGDGLQHASVSLGEYKGVPTRQWKWEETAATAFLEGRGLKVPDEFQKMAHVCNVNQAGDRLPDIGSKLLALLKPFVTATQFRKLEDAHSYIEYETFPGIVWPMMGNPPDSPAILEDVFQPFAKAAREHLPPKHPKREEIDRWLDVVKQIGLWFARQKRNLAVG